MNDHVYLDHLQTFLEWDGYRSLDGDIGALCLGNMEALLLWHLNYLVILIESHL